jgi:hypothetical protein
MKFFTRKLHNSMQPLDGLPENEEERRWAKASDRWEQTCNKYRQHLRRIRKSLPKSMQGFSRVTLHDGIIHSATRERNGSLVIQVDATNNPWGPTGFFERMRKIFRPAKVKNRSKGCQ